MNKKYKSKCQLTFLLQTKFLLLQFYRCSIGAQRRPGYTQGAGVLRDISFFIAFTAKRCYTFFVATFLL